MCLLLRRLKTQNGETVNIVDSIGSNYWKFGTLILNSWNQVKSIEKSCHYQVECIVPSILNHWLDGEGVKPVSWNKLIVVLEESGLSVLASDIRSLSSKDEL